MRIRPGATIRPEAAPEVKEGTSSVPEPKRAASGSAADRAAQAALASGPASAPRKTTSGRSGASPSSCLTQLAGSCVDGRLVDDLDPELGRLLADALGQRAPVEAVVVEQQQPLEAQLAHPPGRGPGLELVVGQDPRERPLHARVVAVGLARGTRRVGQARERVRGRDLQDAGGVEDHDRDRRRRGVGLAEVGDGALVAPRGAGVDGDLVRRGAALGRLGAVEHLQAHLVACRRDPRPGSAPGGRRRPRRGRRPRWGPSAGRSCRRAGSRPRPWRSRRRRSRQGRARPAPGSRPRDRPCR